MQYKRSIVILAGVSTALLWASNAGASDIQWMKSFDDAKKTARERGALMMVDFYADW